VRDLRRFAHKFYSEQGNFDDAAVVIGVGLGVEILLRGDSCLKSRKRQLHWSLALSWAGCPAGVVGTCSGSGGFASPQRACSRLYVQS
jgi:hypothetical protein